MSTDLDTSRIRHWRSILTLVVFVLTNLAVLFPFHVPVPIPRPIWNGTLDALGALRIIRRRRKSKPNEKTVLDSELVFEDGKRSTPRTKASAFQDRTCIRCRFPIDMVTAPLIADLFLLATIAIGRQEVYDGTVGTDGISPIDVMVFFLSLAYIAISIDNTGIIRWLALKVLQRAGGSGKLLYLYLYLFFFGLASFIGNDPIVLSGTPFLAYMTRVAANIRSPRAWIFMQFAVANMASAILVSSNPTNLVLSGAFDIKFIRYTANMIVPVIITAVVLFPFLLFVAYRSEEDVPKKVEMHDFDYTKAQKPVNPNIPYAAYAQDGALEHMDEGETLSLDEIMNPYVDRKSAIFSGTIMAVTLVTILAVNASLSDTGSVPVFYITLPAAVIVFCWDVSIGWTRKDESRRIAREGRDKAEQDGRRDVAIASFSPRDAGYPAPPQNDELEAGPIKEMDLTHDGEKPHSSGSKPQPTSPTEIGSPALMSATHGAYSTADLHQAQQLTSSATLVSSIAEGYQWCQETFPTATAVLTHLPWKLVPFALCMFVLVQALVTRGWVAVFAHGWAHWVNATHTIGAIGGMAFLSVVLCNFAGTNIGTTILLCRVVQAWVEIKGTNSIDGITDRTFWATVYTLALGVNYGAFSTAFSASLAGLLWRDILAKKGIAVKATEFFRANLSLITVTTIVGCAVLIGEVWIVRSGDEYYVGG